MSDADAETAAVVSESDSEQPRSRTKTKTRKEVNVETVTVEEDEYLCPNCSQWFAEENIVPIGIGVHCSGDSYRRDDVDDIHEFDQLCRTCTKKVFGYSSEEGFFAAVHSDLEYWDSDDFEHALRSVLGTLIVVGALVAIPAIVLTAGFAVVEGLASSTAEALNQAEPSVGFKRIPIILVGLIFMVVIHLLRIFGGGSR